MENVITFTRYWYLIKRTTNSAGIRANWINCLLYEVRLNSHIFPVLNIYCSEAYLGPLQRSYVFILTESCAPNTDKIIVQFFECKIPERVFLNGAISICRRFLKVSHRFKAKMCGLSLLAVFYVLSIYIMTYNTRFVFQTKKWYDSTGVFDNKTYL